MSGSNTNDFRFAGEQLDPETGLYYLRARQYDPGLGRFTSRDSVAPGPRNTRALNQYSYAYNNPANLVDPSGKYVLIIGGFGTNYDGEANPESNWKEMKKRLAEEFPNEDIGHFDWSAGGMHDRAWAATTRSVEETAPDLANLLYWIARKKLSRPNETIKIIGHSKGGALLMEYLNQIAAGSIKQDEEVLSRLSAAVTLDSPLNLDPIRAGALYAGGNSLAFLPERLRNKTNVQIINIDNGNDWVGHGRLLTRDRVNYTYRQMPRADTVQGHMPDSTIGVHGLLQTDPEAIEFIIGKIKYGEEFQYNGRIRLGLGR